MPLSKIGTIREFKTQNFHVIVDAVEENDLDLSWDDSGETRKGLENGSLIAFCARARVFLRGMEVSSLLDARFAFLRMLDYRRLTAAEHPGDKGLLSAWRRTHSFTRRLFAETSNRCRVEYSIAGCPVADNNRTPLRNKESKLLCPLSEL